MTGGWRIRVALGEGLRNWAYGRWVTAIVTLVAVVSVAAPATVDSIQVAKIAAAEQAWLKAGGRVLIASNEKEGVSMEACETLGGIDGVEGAVAVTRQRGMAGTSAAPGATVSVTTVTAGISRFLRVDSIGDGAIIAASVEGAVGSGSWIELRPDLRASQGDQPESVTESQARIPAEPVRVAMVSDLSILGDANAYGVLLPVAASGRADACFVRADAGYVEPLRKALPALLGRTAENAPTIVVDRLSGGAFARNYVTEFRQRTSAALAYLAGFALGVFWLMVRWMRRSQDGLYATLGADSVTKAVIRSTEWLVVILIGLFLGYVSSGWIVVASGYSIREATPFMLRSMIVTASVASAVGTLWFLVPHSDPLAALKDR